MQRSLTWKDIWQMAPLRISFLIRSVYNASNVTSSTISNVLKGQLIIMKKLEDAPAERNAERTKAQRQDFATWLLHNPQRYNFIYIDGAGIIRTRARARRGDRAVRIVQERRGQNLTMTYVVNVMNGLVQHELHQGVRTAERFHQFLHDTSLQCNPGQEVWFIFDNA
ncbi:DDE superfamily endonuclease [Elysia marginata]|uniref:DDE superfamily endonuclease n=1 Tax=Elysia marginata TaxID=1093978 RepID=A0AAV4JKJ5_9GAST|nr:DDE superfamily endonuclease [Elysia marginata]